MRKVYCAVLLMVCSLSWPLARASAQTLTLDERVAALEAKLTGGHTSGWLARCVGRQHR
jgi:hypothetical protein